MKEEFIPYEQALALKELGFDEPCLAGFFHYVSDNPEKARQLLTPKDSIFGENYMFKNSVDFIEQLSMAVNHHPICNKNCSAPLYQQAFRWFRDNYGLASSITLKMKNGKRVSFFIIYELDNRLIKSKFFNSYTTGKIYGSQEETELECLKKLIEIVTKIKE